MPRRPASPDPTSSPLPEIHLARDLPRHVLRQGLASGAVVRVRAGAYAAPSAGGVWEQRRRLAQARIAAVTAQLSLDMVVSHQSAALLWGLPMVDRGAQVHIIQRSAAHRRGAADVVRHEHELSDGEVVDLAGVRVTSLERTMTDCALSLRPSAALVVCDAGLRRGAARDHWSTMVGASAGRRGIVTARAVLELADDGAESAGESLARYLVLRAGLPVPQTQVRIVTVDGTYWSDIGWPQWHVAIEYDGRAKYSAAGDAAEAVLAERRREVAIHRAGWHLVRVTASDLRRPAMVVDEVLRGAPPGSRRLLAPRRELADPLARPRPRG